MKKLTAMLLSLMMCLSLMAMPAQAAFIPDPDGPGIIGIGEVPIKPGDDDPAEPGISPQSNRLPGELGDMPTD